MCFGGKKKYICVYYIVFVFEVFLVVFSVKLNSENLNLLELFFFFLIVKYSRDLYILGENLCFNLKILFKECEFIF